MTTAAEKLDLVPPWCVVKKGDVEWCVVSHDDTHLYSETGIPWPEPKVRGGYIHTEAEARRIARLTSPLDSWEPPADCPLPVEGWSVRRCATGPGWFVAAIGDNSIFSVSGAVNKRFDTRRAAIVWAWAEAEAPASSGHITVEAARQELARLSQPRPITEADVRVGQRWKGGLHVRMITEDGYYHETDKRGYCRTREEIVRFINNEGWTLITDGTGATDGPSDDRGTLDWAAFDELCETTDHSINALDDRIGAVETKVEDMADVLARICPDADSQTDGKGRTLVEIDRQLDAVVGWMNDDARPEFDKIDDRYNVIRRDAETLERRTHSHEMRLTYLERLIAAQVAKPATLATRSDDASTNELATEAAAVDDGWREMLQEWCADYGPWIGFWFLVTPDGKYAFTEHEAISGWLYITDDRKCRPVEPGDDCENRDRVDKRRRTCPTPPNLAEWYKPKAKADVVAATWKAQVDGAWAALPTAFRIEYHGLSKCVRSLAAAHKQAVMVQDQYRQRIAELERSEGDLAVDNAGWMRDVERLNKQLADANAAAVAAEGRAHTAMKRASKAEEELADLRGKVENLRAAFSG